MNDSTLSPENPQPKQPHNQQLLHSLIKQVSGQSRVLTIPRLYIDATGDHVTALVLSQIVYWSDRASATDGWFAKSYVEWQDELALSQYQVNRAVKVLKAFGVETMLKRSEEHNAGATLHYRVDMDILTNWIIKFLDNQKTSQRLKKSRKNTSPAKNAGDVSARVQDEWYNAIRDVWAFNGGRNGDMEKMLRGTAEKGEYKTYRLTVEITPDDVRAWGAWWKKNNAGLSMLEKLDKVQSSILGWIEAGKPDAQCDHHKIDGFRIIT